MSVCLKEEEALDLKTTICIAQGGSLHDKTAYFETHIIVVTDSRMANLYGRLDEEYTR